MERLHSNRVSDILLETFFPDGKPTTVEPGEIVYDSDTSAPSLFVVDKGYFKTYTISNDGDLHIQNFYGPGAIFPLAPVLRRALNWTSFRTKQTVYFETLTEASVYRCKAETFPIAELPPEVYQELIYRLLFNYEVFLNCAQVQKFRYARHRIIYQLLLLADMFGTQTEDGIRINPPLTHFDIGSTIGMARETVTREMEKLRSGGCLISSQQHLVLTDTTGLQEEIEDAH